MTRIISLEGHDYAGKSSTTTLLYQHLLENGQQVRHNTGVIHKQALALPPPADDLQRETQYTLAYLIDRYQDDARPRDELFIQDRFWMSTVAYGRFLNKEQSIHYTVDLRRHFIQPLLVVRLSCGIEEAIQRSTARNAYSAFDKLILNNPEQFERLEREITWSLEGQRVLAVDTTKLALADVVTTIEQELTNRGVL
ncbi:MAG: hypothetical protein V1725_07710 [archaeon]